MLAFFSTYELSQQFQPRDRNIAANAYQEDFQQVVPEFEEVKITTSKPIQPLPQPTPQPEVTTFHRPYPVYTEDTNIIPEVRVEVVLDDDEYIKSINQLYPDYDSFNAGLDTDSFNNGFEHDGFAVSEGYERLLEEKIAEIQRAAEDLETKYWGSKMEYFDS